MTKELDKRRVALFLLFAFGIAWLVALLVYWTGGLNSQTAAGQINWRATALVALLYMPAPALAHVLTRWVSGEGWQGVDLRLHLRRNWRYLLLAWLVVPLLTTVIGATLFFLLYPNFFDPGLTKLTQMLRQSVPAGNELPVIPSAPLIGAMLLQAVLLGGIVNAPFTFGEEFGWRGYLQEKLMPLGWRKAMVWMGVIWGAWHWPLIVMGHNYGQNYVGAPWLGMLAMVWFCFVVGVFLGWLQLRSGSIWPATVAHAAINAVAASGALFVQGQPNPLLGPLPTGVIASIGWSLLALWLLTSKPTTEPRMTLSTQMNTNLNL